MGEAFLHSYSVTWISITLHGSGYRLQGWTCKVIVLALQRLEHPRGSIGAGVNAFHLPGTPSWRTRFRLYRAIIYCCLGRIVASAISKLGKQLRQVRVI